MEPTIALRLAASGRMPVLAELLEKSTWGPLQNADGLVVGSVWPSFATGTNPGTHGMYCFRQFVNGEYRIRRFDPYDVQADPFWDVLGRAGRRCAVIDVPLSRPSKDILGTQVVDWGSHDRMLDQTVVGTEAERIVGTHDAHPIETKCDAFANDGRWDELRSALRTGTARRADLARKVMASGSWDVFTVVFAESHCAGHQFWAMHEPTDARHDPALVARLRSDPLEDVYAACDEALGTVLAGAGEDTAVLVVLSHGIGSHHDADHLIGTVLERLGDAIRPRPRVRRLRESMRRGLRRAGGLVSQLDGTVVDASRALWKVPNNELFAGVRVNLAGREPRGFVRPGDDYEGLLDDLTTELLTLRTTDDDRPAVQRVLRSDELYPGRNRDALPDLLIDWNRSKPITGLTSPTVGTVTGTYDGVRSGDHRPTGLVLGTWPGVDAGQRAAVAMTDLAPTITGAVGVGMPDADGSPAAGLLPDHLGAATSPVE